MTGTKRITKATDRPNTFGFRPSRAKGRLMRVSRAMISASSVVMVTALASPTAAPKRARMGQAAIGAPNQTCHRTITTAKGQSGRNIASHWAKNTRPPLAARIKTKTTAPASQIPSTRSKATVQRHSVASLTQARTSCAHVLTGEVSVSIQPPDPRHLGRKGHKHRPCRPVHRHAPAFQPDHAVASCYGIGVVTDRDDLLG